MCIASDVYMLKMSVTSLSERIMLTSMLCNSVVKSVFLSKKWYRDRQRCTISEYVKKVILNNWYKERTLTLTATFMPKMSVTVLFCEKRADTVKQTSTSYL